MHDADRRGRLYAGFGAGCGCLAMVLCGVSSVLWIGIGSSYPTEDALTSSETNGAEPSEASGAIENVAPPAASNLPVSRVEHGRLEDSDARVTDDDSPYDDYSFGGQAGWGVRIDMSSSEFDTYLWLLGPDGEAIVQDDDSGRGTDSSIVFVLPTNGQYTVRANSYDELGRGAYELRIVAGPALTREATPTEPGAGQIDI